MAAKMGRFQADCGRGDQSPDRFLGRSAAECTHLALALRASSGKEAPAFDDALAALDDVTRRERDYSDLVLSL